MARMEDSGTSGRNSSPSPVTRYYAHWARSGQARACRPCQVSLSPTAVDGLCRRSLYEVPTTGFRGLSPIWKRFSAALRSCSSLCRSSCLVSRQIGYKRIRSERQDGLVSPFREAGKSMTSRPCNLPIVSPQAPGPRGSSSSARPLLPRSWRKQPGCWFERRHPRSRNAPGPRGQRVLCLQRH